MRNRGTEGLPPSLNRLCENKNARERFNLEKKSKMRYKEPSSRSELALGLVEDLVDQEHYIRLLDEFVERAVSADEESYSQKGQSQIGQRPYGARTLIKLYLYGYLNRISSSRRLEVETHRNIEMIWLLGGLQPDFKTIADYRRDHGESIRRLFKQLNAFLKSGGYLEGKQVSIDGMRAKANANRGALSIKKIENRLKRLDQELEKYVSQLNYNDEVDDRLDRLDALADKEKESIERIAELHEEIQDLLKKKHT